jgi:AmmeMemoRadiSam system protein A
VTAAEGRVLLLAARAALEADLLDRTVLDRLLAGISRTPALDEPRATFVTLRARRQDGSTELRGCIGCVDPVEPALDSVVRNSRRAAFHDPRFPPLTAAELDGVHIHVSVLTTRVPVVGPEAIVPGRDGVQLDAGLHRAVFLPEVARDQGWDTNTLLAQLARKAGLPDRAWRDGVLSTFRSESFDEAVA